jgi:hypothetical protein
VSHDLANGSVRAFLDFNINYLEFKLGDPLHGLWNRNAMQLKLGIASPIDSSREKCVSCRGGPKEGPYSVGLWHAAFTINHMKDAYFGVGYNYVFGFWQFPLASPWANWQENGPRKTSANGLRFEDTTIFKLDHAPR